MHLQYMLLSLTMLFCVTLLGYIFVIIKEKYYLMNNIVLIDCKGITQQDLDAIELKHFKLGSSEIMAGDEMKICIDNNNQLRGTVLGAKITDNSILMVTDGKKVECISIQEIKKFKIISRYGKFFNII